MALTTSTTEDIIERRESNPVATACIFISTIALLAAIVLQLVQVAELTPEGAARQEAMREGRYVAAVKEEIATKRERVDKILADGAVVPTDVETYEDVIGDPALVARIRQQWMSGAQDGDSESTEDAEAGGDAETIEDEPLSSPDDLEAPSEPSEEGGL